MSKIGVFDSGLGGLTVLKNLLEHHQETDFIYLGDNARVPYGNKSEATIIKYSEQAVEFLLSKGVHTIIIACNTSSAIALEYLNNKFKDVNFIGMIKPAAKGAVNLTKSKKIGVIGTQATINSKSYLKEIAKYGEYKVLTKATPLFVPFVEAGMISHRAVDLIIEEYLSEFKGEIDTLILACTHYPFLIEGIRKYLGDSVNIIDTGYYASLELNNYYKISNRKIEYFVTDEPNNFISIAENNLKIKIDNIQKVSVGE
jgi:glutamate racemase